MSSAAKRPAAGPADEAPAGGHKAARSAPPSVHPARIRPLRSRSAAGAASNDGPVVYWMSRDQRVRDNWALLHAAQSAASAGRPLAVVFNLLPSFLGTTGQRHFGFMLRSLRQVSSELDSLGIPFFLLRGADPAATLPPFLSSLRASLLVTDFSPLREGRKWRTDVAAALTCPFDEVDAHNVVPVWSASPKLEYAARTMRPKITALLPQFLTEFTAIPPVTAWPNPGFPGEPARPDWAALISDATAATPGGVPEVSGFAPGEAAAAAALASFLSPSRLRLYAEKRNDPNVPQALSGLSPWIHFGQLSAQRCVLAAQAVPGGGGKAVESFVEELVVRRELSDNFCLHNSSYDTLAGASEWARASLELHASDPRPHLYTRAQLEGAGSADLLWNAAQLEMVHTGKMHGWCRMYWAKKILEWSPSPAEALANAIYLNDKYSLDGRDPNGYVGCMWSIAGIHDMGWAERPVFGKIRYMNFAGAKRKFNVDAYVNRIAAEVKAIKAKAASAAPKAAPAAAAAGPS